MTAAEVSQAIKNGLSASFSLSKAPTDNILLCPMADGGEGSMGVMERAFRKDEVQYEKIFIESVNHLGSPILAPVLMFHEDGIQTAFIEMASVCGLNMIPRDKRNLLRSTTYGLGSVIRSVIERHSARRIILAIGGSGTNDGGFGMLAALGWSFSNSSPFRNKDIPTFISGIESASDLSVQSVCPHLNEVEIIVASDVTSPLLGPSGATAVYGPQKGCKKQEIPVFENALQNWATVIGYPDFPGAGAAGGFAAATDQTPIAFIGDSTFFHAGVPALVNALFNDHKIIMVILDNRTTAMTGHQPNPGTGREFGGIQTEPIDIEKLVRGIGVKYVEEVDPYDVKAATKAMKGALEHDGVAVIISKCPCPLELKKRKMLEVKRCEVDQSKCIRCYTCLKMIACPSLIKRGDAVEVDPTQCIGCGMCANVCPKNAIEVKR